MAAGSRYSVDISGHERPCWAYERVRGGCTVRDRIVSGEAIRRRRLQLELTQRRFAELCGHNGRPMATSFVKYVEAGRCQPSDVNAQRMARVLQCTVEDFSTPKPAPAAATAEGSAA